MKIIFSSNCRQSKTKCPNKTINHFASWGLLSLVQPSQIQMEGPNYFEGQILIHQRSHLKRLYDLDTNASWYVLLTIEKDISLILIWSLLRAHSGLSRPSPMTPCLWSVNLKTLKWRGCLVVMELQSKHFYLIHQKPGRWRTIRYHLRVWNVFTPLLDRA